MSRSATCKTNGTHPTPNAQFDSLCRPVSGWLEMNDCKEMDAYPKADPASRCRGSPLAAQGHAAVRGSTTKNSVSATRRILGRPSRDQSKRTRCMNVEEAQKMMTVRI